MVSQIGPRVETQFDISTPTCLELKRGSKWWNGWREM